MGTFHTICNTLSILGKRFGDGGLKYILIESQIVEEGSINGVIDGKYYNRAVRAHKNVYEVLMRLIYIYIYILMHKSNNPEHHTSVTSFLEMMNTMVMDISQVSFDKLLERPVLCHVMAIW